MLREATLAILIGATPVATGSEWEVKTEVEPMTDVVVVGASSGIAKPLARPRFPLSDLAAKLSFICVKEMDISVIEILLTSRLAMKDSRLELSGDYTFSSRVRWDKEPSSNERVKIKDRAARELYLDMAVLDKIKKHNTFLFEISPEGYSRIIFEFDLSGATKAINEAQAACKA